MEISRVGSLRCQVGESPVWDEREQALFLVDIAGTKLHRFDPVTGEVRSWQTPGMVTAMALAEPGKVLLGIGDTIHEFELASGTHRPLAIAAGQPANATINDGRVDRQGRFVFGSCCTDFASPTPVGGIYGLDKGGCKRLAGGIAFSNGTCFSPVGDRLYFADSAVHSVFAFDYDIATGTVAERRILADTRPLGGIPDGATVDAAGRIWVTINEGGKVAVFEPDGALVRTIDLPAKRPGSLAFGGRNLDRLFVTTIDPAYFGEQPDDEGGHVFVIDDLGATGLPEPRYRA